MNCAVEINRKGGEAVAEKTVTRIVVARNGQIVNADIIRGRISGGGKGVVGGQLGEPIPIGYRSINLWHGGIDLKPDEQRRFATAGDLKLCLIIGVKTTTETIGPAINQHFT